MKNIQYALIFAITITPLYLRASMCIGPFFSITELLNHDSEGHHIFTCRIISTHLQPHSWESVAVVNERFRGQPSDTVYLSTGGVGYGFGKKLFPGDEWIIFSTSKDSLHYGAVVCDPLSAQLTKNERSNCHRNNTYEAGKIYFPVLAEYEKIAASRYTGYRTITANERILAEGAFINGLPDGEWTHYDYDREKKTRIRRSTINYANGQLHGEYFNYYTSNGIEEVAKRQRFRFDLPLEIAEGNSRMTYEYINERERVISRTRQDSSGAILFQETTRELKYDQPQRRLHYKDGIYINRFARDSSSYTPLAEGQFFRGARVGEWKFFNKQGKLVRTEVYPDIAVVDTLFTLYDETGHLSRSGIYKNGKQLGIWKVYRDGQLAFESAYDEQGELLNITRYRRGSKMNNTPYRNGEIHGQQMTWRADGQLRSITNYHHGDKKRSITYGRDGSIENQTKYLRSRAFTVVRDTSQIGFNNGLKNGYYRQHDHETGELIREGRYWNGYQIGVWVKYSDFKKGGYTKTYYPESEQVLMLQCGDNVPLKSEYYDVKHQLKNTMRY